MRKRTRGFRMPIYGKTNGWRTYGTFKLEGRFRRPVLVYVWSLDR